jgi:hypothetical protein
VRISIDAHADLQPRRACKWTHATARSRELSCAASTRAASAHFHLRIHAGAPAAANLETVNMLTISPDRAPSPGAAISVPISAPFVNMLTISASAILPAPSTSANPRQLRAPRNALAAMRTARTPPRRPHTHSPPHISPHVDHSSSGRSNFRWGPREVPERKARGPIQRKKKICMRTAVDFGQRARYDPHSCSAHAL